MVNIHLKVRRLVHRWGTRNPFLICKYLKIIIIYADLGKVKGCHKKILGKNVIWININLSERDKKIVCAHELGHCLFHANRAMEFLLEYKMAKISLDEKQANEFTALLLQEENMEDYSHEITEIDKKIWDEFNEYIY